MSYTYPGMNKQQNRGKVPGMIMLILGIGMLVFFFSSLIMIENGAKTYVPSSVLFYSFPVISGISILVGIFVWIWDDKRNA